MSSSSSIERDQKRKRKKPKERQKSCGNSEPRGGRRGGTEDFHASGLLDEDSAPRASLAPAVSPGAGAMRGWSRSRDEGSPVQSNAQPAAGGKGKGKGGGQGKGKDSGEQGPDEPKEEPNFEASGLLAVEDNAKNGIPLKFTTPPEARLPGVKWRLYVFTKQQEEPKILHVHRQLAVLFGKDRRVADVPTDHPTCSKQHAVMHFRLTVSGHVKPYILDLESTNGTFLNGERIESARYTELRERDVLKFGMSSREFVLLHGGSANHLEIGPGKLPTLE